MFRESVIPGAERGGSISAHRLEAIVDNVWTNMMISYNIWIISVKERPPPTHILTSSLQIST